MEKDIWWIVRHIYWKSGLMIVSTKPSDMPIFHCELCLRFIFLAQCETLNFVDVGRHTRTAWTITPSCHSIMPVMSIFLIKVFSLSTFHRLSTVQKHLTWLCKPCWLANILSNVRESRQHNRPARPRHHQSARQRRASPTQLSASVRACIKMAVDRGRGGQEGETSTRASLAVHIRRSWSSEVPPCV